MIKTEHVQSNFIHARETFIATFFKQVGLLSTTHRNYHKVVAGKSCILLPENTVFDGQKQFRTVPSPSKFRKPFTANFLIYMATEPAWRDLFPANPFRAG
jgi:hypothetical protein